VLAGGEREIKNSEPEKISPALLTLREWPGKFKLKAEQERMAAVIRAEGESEAARLITEATNVVGASFIELRRIEAAKEIAAKLAVNRRITYIPGGQSSALLLNLPQQQ